MELGYKLINEANKELSLFQSKLANYYWGYDGEDRRQRYWMGVAYARFKCTLLCSLIAHSRGIVHLANCSLEDQEKFLEANKDEWEYLVHRIPKEKPVVQTQVVPKPPPKKNFVERLKALL